MPHQKSIMNDTWKQSALPRIEAIFRDQFLNDELKITEFTTPADIDQWDSLAHINLLAAIEAEFEVRFSADQMSQIDSVSSLLVTLGPLASRKASR
jgi:acyl carrier protein